MWKYNGVGVFENDTHLLIASISLIFDLQCYFKISYISLSYFIVLYFILLNFFPQGSVQLDDGNYSEPVLHLIAYKQWRTLTVPERQDWAKLSGLIFVCMMDFVLSVDDLFKRVNRYLGGEEGKKSSGDSSQNIDKEKFLDDSSLNLSHIITERELNFFRLIITWASKDNIIRQEGNGKIDEKVTLKMKEIHMREIENLFPVSKKVSIIDDKKWQDGEYKTPFKVSYEG
jgi:hypothetical protein